METGNDRTATAENVPVSKQGLLPLYAQELRFRNAPVVPYVVSVFAILLYFFVADPFWNQKDILVICVSLKM
jgi:hypothetical protein